MSRRRTSESLDEVAESVLVASRALIAIAARSMPDGDDVTLSQYRALVVLASRGAITVGYLSELLDVHPSTATRLVDRLEAKGFATRSTAADRREVVVELAAPAVQLLGAVTADRRRQIRQIVERLPPDAVDDLLRSFRAFSDAAGEVPDSQWAVLLDAPAEPPSPESP